ncbi:hypothetical protein [Streptomyces sp. S063]|uniref:hypothetical protein n=1 Tax=Streptomyces sp. S063 TaxID=2005885 RepID=UPI0010083AB2|nr:hypothetical protein [Streptomyces sp. S063]
MGDDTTHGSSTGDACTAAASSTRTIPAGAFGRPRRPRHAPPESRAPSCLAFRAFHTLQEPAYRAYADTHTTPSGSGLALGRAFGGLAAHCSQTVLRIDPAPYTWNVFT